MTPADRTLKSLATMLGWVNVPPQHIFEAEIRALKARVADLSLRVERAEQELAEERRVSREDPCEQRAERYAMEAYELSGRLIKAEAALSTALGERDALLSATTRELDIERRRWYAALEKAARLELNVLEGLAPEVAVSVVSDLKSHLAAAEAL